MVKFLVLALFYGDHPELAQRCGHSLRALWNTGEVDLRIGLNEVSARSRAVLEELLPGVESEVADPQIYKYPMIRRLVAGYHGDATHMMWFDDDSCLQGGLDVRAWLAAVAARAGVARGTLGSIYTEPLTPVQREWLVRQPWYTGRALPKEVAFNTGGWIVVPLELMRRFGWPGPELRHAGGDIVLGVLLQQQGLEPGQFRVGVAINADPHMRESAAPRRGITEPRDSEVWHIWSRGR